jgi:hypothetical protein
MPEKVKGTVFRENRLGDHKLAYDEQFTNYIFWIFLTLKVLSVYMENTLKCKKTTSFGQKPKSFEILVFTLYM